MASSPACGMPEQGQRWAVRAARAAAHPSTDEGQEGTTEPRKARCIPCLHTPGFQQPSRAAGLSPEPGRQLCPSERLLAAHTHHVGGQLMPRQVLDILVLRVDDVREPPAAHLLLQHPHVHLALEAAQPRCVAAGDLGDGRAPGRAKGSRGSGHWGAQGTTGHPVTCRKGDGWHRLPGVPGR